MLDCDIPQTGKPVCPKRQTCMTQNPDVLFAPVASTAAGMQVRRRVQIVC